MKEVLTLDYYTCDTCDLLITPGSPRMIAFWISSKYPDVGSEDKHFCTPICAKEYLKDIDENSIWNTIQISIEELSRILNET